MAHFLHTPAWNHSSVSAWVGVIVLQHVLFTLWHFSFNETALSLIHHDRRPEMGKDIRLLRRAAEMEVRRTRWGVQSRDGGERSCQGSAKVVLFLFTAFWLELDRSHKELLSEFKKEGSSNQQQINLYYLSHLSPISFQQFIFLVPIIRATIWEAIREKLTQHPASLSRLQPHQPAPSLLGPGWPAITLGSGLVCCKIFIDAPLGSWELCTNTLTHCQTDLHVGNSQTKTIKC